MKLEEEVFCPGSHLSECPSSLKGDNVRDWLSSSSDIDLFGCVNVPQTYCSDPEGSKVNLGKRKENCKVVNSILGVLCLEATLPWDFL